MGSARSHWQTFTVAAVICHLLTTEGVRSKVHGKVGGTVELECSIPSSDPAAAPSASQHVVEWIRQGFDIPVLIKFGSYAPRVHPHYDDTCRDIQSMNFCSLFDFLPEYNVEFGPKAV